MGVHCSSNHNTNPDIMLLENKQTSPIIVYKFYDVKKFVKSKEYRENKLQIIQLFNKCFNRNLTFGTIDGMMDYFGKMIICYDNNKIVGLCFTQIKDRNTYLYKNEEKEMKPYVRKSYHSTLISSKNVESVLLDPFVSGICRNQESRYRGLGEKMLNKFIEYLKLKYDCSRIYIGVNSDREADVRRGYDVYNLCNYGYEWQDTPFYRSNVKLLKYYENIGFKILENYYYIEKCCDPASNNYFAANVMYKDI